MLTSSVVLCLEARATAFLTSDGLILTFGITAKDPPLVILIRADNISSQSYFSGLRSVIMVVIMIVVVGDCM
jgi:hypothetical protein